MKSSSRKCAAFASLAMLFLAAACSSSSSPPANTSNEPAAGSLGTSCSQDTNCTAGPSPLCLTTPSGASACSSTCASDGDCPGGECIAGLMQAADGTPVAGCAPTCTTTCPRAALVCASVTGGGSVCVLACESNEDCGAGSTCDTATGGCSTGTQTEDSGTGVMPPVDSGTGVVGDAAINLSGCAYTQCPASVTCGSPQGSSGTYPLVCVNSTPIVSSLRSSATCEFEIGTPPSPAVFTFPPTYTCNSATIVCNWPEGSISCPASWLIPAQGGGMSVAGGCCGFLSSADTSPSCGIQGNPYCTAPVSGDTSE
ncbi:MAG: hypothetical protein ACLQVI_22160 [Polyangiaceae bacterium]